MIFLLPWKIHLFKKLILRLYVFFQAIQLLFKHIFDSISS